METIEHGERKANKEHVCDFCGGNIAKGETYLYQVIKGDAIFAWKSHKKCDELTRTLNMQSGDDEGISTGDFCDYVTDAVNELKLHERVDALVYILERRRLNK